MPVRSGRVRRDRAGGRPAHIRQRRFGSSHYSARYHRCLAAQSAAEEQCVPEETAMIRGIKFVSIPFVDQDRALAFYTEKLGFRVATFQPFDGNRGWVDFGF